LKPDTLQSAPASVRGDDAAHLQALLFYLAQAKALTARTVGALVLMSP
jgi:hypothetical protein